MRRDTRFGALANPKRHGFRAARPANQRDYAADTKHLQKYARVAFTGHRAHHARDQIRKGSYERGDRIVVNDCKHIGAAKNADEKR